MRPNVRPKKHLGQNFLKHPEIAEKIVRAGNVTKKDIVIEVGPGFGILTEALAKKAGKVIAIEVDYRMKNTLETLSQKFPNVEIIFGDALRFAPPAETYKLIANIPYPITSPLLRHFLQNKNPPRACVLMVQKEVAERICASPPRMNMLALNVQAFGKPKILFQVSRNVFFPKPKVNSAVIEIKMLKKPMDLPFEIIKTAFSQKRKTTGNSLKKIFGEKTPEILEKIGIVQKRRPETLALEEWLLLRGFRHMT